ncbi:MULTISPECIES: MFS transporter [Ensifer]|uniref:MFS transporter n=1 Tax=Ensifer TaxID=106591 RepID=UPI00046D227C|nr:MULTISPECIES: MFS transporter [Ensifer]MDP9631255.1 MFS family permease [Ensifer adhaerens]KQU95455.1 MFS transporter [Ensifer sp. Root31]KQW39876.1 MFS transporter [Ensifer sp. Root1252]KQW60143.1 MFS transporter [Ensifer sp. Root127]KQY61092.1 MFS transporter [Ensifer sp. Root142]
MRKNLLPVASLLLGTLFLFLGNGLQGLLLPVRGTAEGYPTTILGLIGTSWAAGFVLGCFFAPNVVKRIGHVRAFSVFTSMIAIVALMTGILIDPTWWLILRALTGFSTAGTSMIIESWLNERATNESRGVIFSLYIAITLFGVVGGQMMIPFGDTSTSTLFMICGILYCVAMLPTLLSKAASPQPLKQVQLDLRGLYRNSPVSFLGILLVGIANGAFGTLGAVFGRQAGLSDSTVAAMMSVAIFAGAVMQLPAGRLSDRIDRRYVLAALAGVGALAGLLIFLVEPSQVWIVLTLIAIYGAAANALYPIAVSHANDFATAEDFVKVSGGLLLLYGIGTIIGPTIGGPVMTATGPYGLFMITACAHILITAYAIIRSRMRAPVPVAERDAFSPINAGTAMTPESLQLSPRAAPFDETHDDDDGDIDPEQEEKSNGPV